MFVKFAEVMPMAESALTISSRVLAGGAVTVIEMNVSSGGTVEFCVTVVVTVLLVSCAKSNAGERTRIGSDFTIDMVFSKHLKLRGERTRGRLEGHRRCGEGIVNSHCPKDSRYERR